MIEIEAGIKAHTHTYGTTACRAKALRRVLRYLWENHGAPKLDHLVKRYSQPRPRNITVTDAERDALLAAAPPYLQLFILLCSDLAIRSGTAVEIGPSHHDPEQGTLTFTTKNDERLTLPTTIEITALIEQCDRQSSRSFIRQLWIKQRQHGGHGLATTLSRHSLGRNFRILRDSLGLRPIRPHDFRRTTAVAIYRHTGDVRDAQALLGHKAMSSTFWYLDHNVRPVKRHTLELIKRTDWRKEHTA